MQVIKEDFIRKIGNGNAKAINPDEVDSHLSSDMRRFCVGCEKFSVVFRTGSDIKHLQQGERIEGEILFKCENQPFNTLEQGIGATMQWIDRKRINRNGFCFIKMDDVPPSLKTQIENLVRTQKCVFAKNCKDCAFYVERMITEGNL